MRCATRPDYTVHTIIDMIYYIIMSNSRYEVLWWNPVNILYFQKMYDVKDPVFLLGPASSPAMYK